MNANNLVTMANQIGAFFETMPDREQALTDIAGHLKRFWEPRMRRSLLQHVDEHAGVQLKDIVLEALRTHRAAVL
ncbi:formate dehydrogenase subunit delta [Polaromonas sp. UC242_47]|uniref:formate dehydrogenase subunit delta n=1 Tax=Polaromonas sp. UC242_47 TaxID=3374626 RepID=UPI00378CCBBA